MRGILSVLLAVSLLFVVGYARAEEPRPELQGTVTMSGAWALYPMAVKWAEEFQKIHPKVKIDIAAGGAGKGMADALAKVVDIGMVSRDVYPAEVEKGAWWVSVTKDAVVPTINEANPLLKDVLAKGIKKDAFIGIWITGEIKDWNKAIALPAEAGKKNIDLHVYTRSDACGAAEVWAGYMGKKQEDLKGVGVYGDPGLTVAVKKDSLGIGFNNINYAYDSKTKKPLAGIRVIPIDLNGNGRIDKEEDFYGTSTEISSAIADGRYPSPPARALHFVSKGKPAKSVVTEFVKWLLTDGQKYVPEAGYINLTKEKLDAEVKKLEGKE